MDDLSIAKLKNLKYGQIRILQIFEQNKVVVVLIKIILLWMKQYIAYLVIIMMMKSMIHQKVCFDIALLS
jgi:hypothetical protein